MASNKQKLQIQKLGDGFGILLPDVPVERFDLKPGSELELRSEGDSFFISLPVTLDQLLASVPDGESLTELDSGPDLGKER